MFPQLKRKVICLLNMILCGGGLIYLLIKIKLYCHETSDFKVTNSISELIRGSKYALLSRKTIIFIMGQHSMQYFLQINNFLAFMSLSELFLRFQSMYIYFCYSFILNYSSNFIN